MVVSVSVQDMRDGVFGGVAPNGFTVRLCMRLWYLDNAMGI